MKRQTVLIALILAALMAGSGAWLSARQRPAPRGKAQVATTTVTPAPPAPVPATPPTLRIATGTSTPIIGTPTATPSMITVNTPTQVMVSIQITDPRLVPNSVNLLRLSATGAQSTILGVMQTAGNGTYSLQPAFDESVPGAVQLQVSAAFQGSLLRVLSNVVTVSAWGVLADPLSGFKALYPPSLYNLSNTTPSSRSFSLQSSPQGVSIGVGPEDGSTATTTGFAVIISPSQYSGNFDINAWLSMVGLTDEADMETPILVGGMPGYEITFKNEVGAGQPTVVVYNQGYIYQISYASTFSPASPADQPGISAFNSVVQNFTFSH